MASLLDAYALPDAFPEPGKTRLPQRPKALPFLEARMPKTAEIPSIESYSNDAALAGAAKAWKGDAGKGNQLDDILKRVEGMRPGALNDVLWQMPRNGYFQGMGGSGAPVRGAAASPTAGPDTGDYDPNASVAGVPEGYFRNLYGAESSNNPNAVNTSGGTNASGLGGLLPATYAGIVKEAPHLGLSPDGILDPGMNRQATEYYTAKSVGILKELGIPVTSQNLYALHHFGYGGGPKLIANQSAPLKSIFGPEIFRANPYMNQYQTGADLMGLFNKKFGGTR
jgi:hypothetical protein